MKSASLAATTLAAVLAWTMALIVNSEPWNGAPVLLIGLGTLATGTVAVTGVILTGGRWAHLLGLGVLSLTVAIAIARPIDVWWWVGVAATGTALVAMLSPAVTVTIRKLPSATGPPPRAILPALTLLIAPALIGFLGNEAPTWTLLATGLSAPIFAFLYSRVIPGGLLGVRVLWPLLSLSAAPFMGWPAGVMTGVLATSVAWLSWNPAVKASYHPPVESGTTFPIPPELAPSEILDAARIDDQGRPL